MANMYGRGKHVATMDKPSGIRIYKTLFPKIVSPNKPGRVCVCGTVLSIYNPDRMCNLCKRKRLDIET